MLAVAGLRVGFLQRLKHRTLAAIGLRPDAIHPSVKPFGKRAQESDVMVERRVEGQRQQQATIKALGCLMKIECRLFEISIINGVPRSEEHTSELPSLMRI